MSIPFVTTIGIPQRDIIYPYFTVSPGVGSIAGGTTLTLTFPNGGGLLVSGVTVGGQAATFTIVDDTTVTCTTPELTVGQKNVVGTFTGYAPYTAVGAFTAANVTDENEGTRNTDPGIGNVVKDVAYKHLGVDKTGIFEVTIPSPGDFIISAQPENYDSVKVNISLSSNAYYYIVYRDNVDVSGRINSHYFIDPCGPGTFTYKVIAYGAGDKTSNEVMITRDSTGFVDLTSMITFIQKMLLNRQTKVTESGVTYLVTYDDDDVNIICKQPLKTFEGNNVVVTENSAIPEQRLRSLIYSVGTINEADFTNLVTMITKDHFFMKKIEERPRNSGVKQHVLYDSDNKTVLHSNRLKTFNNNDLGNLSGSTAPAIREKSVL